MKQVLTTRYVNGGASDGVKTPPPGQELFVAEVLNHDEEEKPVSGMHQAVNLRERAQRTPGKALEQSG